MFLVFLGIATLLHCYMLHVTLRDMQFAKRGEKTGQRIVDIKYILYLLFFDPENARVGFSLT